MIPNKLQLRYKDNVLVVNYVDDYNTRIKMCPVLRTKALHCVAFAVDELMDSLMQLGVSNIDLIWSTRKNRLDVNSMSLITDDIFTDVRATQVQAMLYMLVMPSEWLSDFPEKVNITMDRRGINLTAI